MTSRANQYATMFTELYGVSVAPLGIPDPRPSRCTYPPNLNLP